MSLFFALLIVFILIHLIKHSSSNSKKQKFPQPSSKPSASSSSPPRQIPVAPSSGSYVPPASSVHDISRSSKPLPRYRDKPKLSVPWPDEKYAEILALRDFCVLDVETTGLECWSCRIVQIGIIKVINNEAVDHLNTYINPETHIPTSATDIHGITDNDVKDAPTYKQIADRVTDLLNNTTVVGHNVTFDLNFVQHILLECSNMQDDLRMEYVDTWEYANRLHLPVPDYKLQTLLKFYGIDPGEAHTAYDDARSTLELFNALRYEYAHKDEMEAKRKAEALEAKRQKREADKAARAEAFSASPLYDVRFCFTGGFSIPRESMEALAASVGAMVQQKGVNGRTNYLVKGDVSDLPEWALERKIGKAEELSSSGKNIKVIDEAEFMRLVADAKHVLTAQQNDRSDPASV